MTLDPRDRAWLDAVRGGRPPGRFGHREHLRLAWLVLDEAGSTAAAQQEVSDVIRALAVAQGAPQKYHRTVTDAWVRVVAHCRAADPGMAFDAVLAARPFLLDKRALTRHYTSRTLAGAAARSGWVEPDLLPLPDA